MGPFNAAGKFDRNDSGGWVFCCVGVVSEEMIGWIYPASRTDKERTSFPIQDVRCAYRGGGINSVKRSQSLKRHIVDDMKCMANILSKRQKRLLSTE